MFAFWKLFFITKKLFANFYLVFCSIFLAKFFIKPAVMKYMMSSNCLVKNK